MERAILLFRSKKLARQERMTTNNNCDAGACKNGHALWFNSFNFSKQQYKLPFLSLVRVFLFLRTRVILFIWTSLCHWNLGAMPSLCEMSGWDSHCSQKQSSWISIALKKKNRAGSHPISCISVPRKTQEDVLRPIRKEKQSTTTFSGTEQTLCSP